MVMVLVETSDVSDEFAGVPDGIFSRRLDVVRLASFLVVHITFLCPKHGMKRGSKQHSNFGLLTPMNAR